MTPVVALRAVDETDVEVFHTFQTDAEAVAMAEFPLRDLVAHRLHWDAIRGDSAVELRTVLVDGAVAGNVVCFGAPGERHIGYWVGRQWWGRGVATAALTLFVDEYDERPLYAQVAPHNLASARVLEKCGFIRLDPGAPEAAESAGLRFTLPA